MAGDYEAPSGAVFDVAGEVGLPVTFTLAIGNAGPPIHLGCADDGREDQSPTAAMSPRQIFPRPSGWCSAWI